MSTEVTTSEFRNEQSRYLYAAQREPVSILSRGALRRAVVVSPDFFDAQLKLVRIGKISALLRLPVERAAK